jgi:hypothetical protein
MTSQDPEVSNQETFAESSPGLNQTIVETLVDLKDVSRNGCFILWAALVF